MKAKKSGSGGSRGASSGASPPSSNLVAVSGGGPGGSGGVLPEGVRSKLWELFGHIEHEFEHLYSENAARELTFNNIIAEKARLMKEVA